MAVAVTTPAGRAGAVWMHLSNGDMSQPRKENIGVDSFGPMIGAGWAF
jgi:hypothetical protein